MERSLTSVDEVYIFHFAANDFAALHNPDPSVRERLRFDGTPVEEKWRPVTMKWDTVDDTRPIPDIEEAMGTPILNQRAIDALGDLIEGKGELLQLDVENDPTAYFVFNVTRTINALARDRSEITFFDDGRVLNIDRHKFDPEQLSGETIFRLDLAPDDVYVTHQFRRRVEEAGLTGFSWKRLVWTADPADLERFEEERRRRIEAERAGDEEGFYTHIVPTPEEVGPPDEVIAHRIVPVLNVDNEDLEYAQAKAHRLGIGPDEAVNGVWLPRERSVTAYTPSYLREVRQRLWPAENREQGVRILREIAAELERGEFPHKGE